MEKKLRLLLFEKCNKRCRWCQNKHWDLSSLPQETFIDKYDEVLMTGGEPMLEPLLVINTAKRISNYSNAKIFLYTSKTDNWQSILSVLHYVDGLTVTIHNSSDISSFSILNNILMGSSIKKYLKINIFNEIKIDLDLHLWTIKHKKWFTDKHLPKGEVFKRL